MSLMQNEAIRLLRERAELVERQLVVAKELQSLKMKRGWREKKLKPLIGQLGYNSIREAEADLVGRDLMTPPDALAATIEASRVSMDLTDPDVDGRPCDECDGAGGDGLCACLGTGWIEAE